MTYLTQIWGAYLFYPRVYAPDYHLNLFLRYCLIDVTDISQLLVRPSGTASRILTANPDATEAAFRRLLKHF